MEESVEEFDHHLLLGRGAIDGGKIAIDVAIFFALQPPPLREAIDEIQHGGAAHVAAGPNRVPDFTNRETIACVPSQPQNLKLSDSELPFRRGHCSLY